MSTLLAVQQVCKSFPGVNALTKVNFDLKPGEVHAIVGENGAGKSTLIKILAGAYQHDEGEIYIDDCKLERHSPLSACEKGIITIYQENTLFPDLTVLENLFIGNEKLNSLKCIDWKLYLKEANAIFSKMGIRVNPYSLAGDLGIAEQQTVQIARALVQKCRILIMDEPTASFGVEEVKMLFQIIRNIKSQGVGIIYISHHLDEVFEISDRITVLRDGMYINTYQKKEVDNRQIINDMIGRDVDAFYRRESSAIGGETLRVENVSLEGKLHDISFSINKGEVLGFYGLVGAGRTELARVLFGACKQAKGSVYLNGKKITPASPKAAIRNHICLIPEDRKESGLVIDFSVKNNMTLPGLFKLKGIVTNKKEKVIVEKYIKELKIKTPSMFRPVKYLSGGNQQKVVLSKWLFTDGDVFIFDEPTRGVDIGAKEDIYRLIVQLAQQGKSIMLITSDMPELLSLSDRVIVMRKGEISGSVSKEEMSESYILKFALGQN